MASKGGVIVVVAGEDKTGEVFNAVKKHLDETEAAAKTTTDSLSNIGKVLKDSLGAVGIAVGLRQIVGQFKEMVTSTMEAAVQIAHLSEQTGISAENLSVLKYAAQATGVDFDTLTKGFKKLAVTTYEADNGNKTAAKGFAQLGISVDDLRAKGDDMYGVLTLVADKFHSMPDGILKSDTAAKIFGARMGSEMIPVLDALGGKMDALKAQAEALGVVWDESGIKKMEALHAKAAEVTAVMQGLAMKLTIDLAPALEDIATGAEAAAEKLAKLMNPGGSLIDQAQRASQIAKSIPEEIEGAQDPSRIGRGAGANKFGLQKELADLEDQHAKKLISDEAYLKQKSELTQKWNQADLRENQAYFSALQDQITTAQSALANVKGGSVAWLKSEQAELTRLLQEQARAMDAIDRASGRIKPPPAPKPPPEGSGSSGAMTVNLGDIFNKQVEDWTKNQADLVAFYQKLDQENIEKMKALQTVDADTLQQIGAIPMQNLGDLPTTAVPQGPKPEDTSAITGEAEKFAHGVFDPLFNLGEAWSKQWKQIRANMLKDMGQAAESQLFGELFGDPSGRGGKGWNGSRSGVDGGPNGSRGGLVSEGISGLGGLLSGLFGGKSSKVSNGTGNSGAGTILSSAASALQVGNAGASGSGGVQVILNNMGTPQTVDSTQTSGGGPEAMILQVILKDQQTNGQITQGFASMFGG